MVDGAYSKRAMWMRWSMMQRSMVWAAVWSIRILAVGVTLTLVIWCIRSFLAYDEFTWTGYQPGAIATRRIYFSRGTMWVSRFEERHRKEHSTRVPTAAKWRFDHDVDTPPWRPHFFGRESLTWLNCLGFYYFSGTELDWKFSWHRRSGWIAVFPMWAVMAFAVPVGFWNFPRWRRKRAREKRSRNGRCENCGYHLCGCAGCCPECGCERRKPRALERLEGSTA